MVESLTIRDKLILTLLAITFLGVVYGLLKLDWGFNEMSAFLFILELVSGALARFSFNKTTEIYIDGFKEIIFVAMICGFANGISIILQDG